MYLNTLDKKECCGCTSCSSICAAKAITMQPDNEGFLYPKKEADKCTGCGLCEMVCPIAQPVSRKETPTVYATYIKDIEQRIQSTSGALFYVIAKQVIRQGGVVFGAVLDKHLKVIHRCASTIDELTPLRGSKYVQSNLNDCYSRIQKLLKEGKLVYFTGSPCQVAGLTTFLRRPYPNLLTSDLVCHGVPSQKIFDLHIDYLERKYKGKVIDYKFRDFKLGGGCETAKIAVSQSPLRLKTHRQPSYNLSPFLYSFMYAYTYRPSCYCCLFAKVPRQGDITLADFWGAPKFHPNMNAKHGISLVLLNTPAGRDMWEKVKSELDYELSDVERAAKHNKNLTAHTSMPAERIGIYERIEQEGYAKIAATTFKSPDYYKIKLKIFISNMIGYKGMLLLKKFLRKS